MTEMDRVTLRGLRGFGRHGVLPHERRDGQSFVVDVAIGLDTRKAAASDDLTDTVDYGGLAEAVVRTVEGECFSLLERLAERIAEGLLDDQRVRSVTVAVRKLRPPVAVDMATAGVRITRQRSP